MKNIILIVENNLEIGENVSELLELAGYKTVVADNGDDGFEAAKTNKPDLILCDIIMPFSDGYDLIRSVKKVPELKTVPFIFMTSKSEGADLNFGMSLGADDYVIKPFDGNHICGVVAGWLKKRNGLPD